MNAEILNEIAQQTFDDYKRVSATFEPHTDLKVKWMRQGDHGWIEFQVTDYLDHAPEHVVRGILEAIKLKLEGIMDAPYPPEVIEYLTSDSFRLEGLDCNIERRIKRMKKKYPDLDYDVELPENSRVHDALTELQDEGVQVSPVMVGTTCKRFGNAMPWATSTLFKEIVLDRTIVRLLSDAQLKAVLMGLLKAVHQDFGAPEKVTDDEILATILDNLDGDEPQADLMATLWRYRRCDNE